MDVVELKAALDGGLYGGKASNLAKLLQAGLPVPNGCALSVKAFDSDGRLKPSARTKIAKWLAKQSSGEHFAVRSSALVEDGAKASWAGQFDTYLNVPSSDIIEKIEACHNGISSRTKAYAAVQDKQNLDIAVVLQIMLRPDYAGVLFTKNPVDQSDRMVIEYVAGVGESLVSGQVTPNSLIWDRQTRRVDAPPASTPFPVEELVRLAETVEALYNHHPQDIEWAYESGQLRLLQSRPITTL